MKKIELIEAKIIYDEDGQVISHPMKSLYYWRQETEPINRNNLTFVGDGLYNSEISKKTSYYQVEFHGESPDVQYREEWADSIRGDILENLMGETNSWYLSYVGEASECFINNIKDDKSYGMKKYLLTKDPNQITFIDSNLPFGFKRGVMKRIFFEVTRDEIKWVTENIWKDAFEVYSIEGYCFPSGMIKTINDWSEEPKDEYLYQKIIDVSDALFYTLFSEHQHFVFLTNKYNINEIRKKLKLDEINLRIESQQDL